MKGFENNLVRFVHTCLTKNPDYLSRFVRTISPQELLTEDINYTINILDFPFDLKILGYDVLKEAAEKQMNTEIFLSCINTAEKMYFLTKESEPFLYPVWTGPVFENSPLIHKTFSTVYNLFKTASYEILIVGYSFSPEQEYVKELYEELSLASKRGCRVDIILNKNENNPKKIQNSWPANIVPPHIFSWKGLEDSSIASLHSKLILVDQKKLLITSANFTLHGMKKNIETGILIENHELIRQIWEQFRTLMQNNELEKH